MSDNSTLNAGSGGDVYRSKDRTGVKTSIVALDLNPGGSESLMAGAMPVTDNSGSLTVDNAGTFAVQAAQSGSWTVTANVGTAGSLALDATLTGGSQKTKLVDSGGTNVATVSAGGALKVDGSAVTQPVSGTFWQATQPISGTVTANAGTGTFAISASALPLPSGAATAAKQPALGTAGSASADVLTIQGIASMTAVKVDGSAVTQPVSGTVTANAGTGTFTVSGAVTQSGTWSVRAQDGSGNALTSKSVGSERAISVAIVDGSGTQVTSFGGSGGTASNFGSAFPSSGTAIGAKDSTGSNMAALNLDASGYLKVNVAAGGGSGGTSSSFGSAVPGTGTAAGYSDGTNMQLARVFDLDTGAGTQYVAGVGIRLSSSGGSVEGGTNSNPLRIDPTGTTTQPVSGTVSASCSGTVTANAGTGTFAISAASLPLPSGASTAAKQPALGTAGTASSDVLTVQGIASMTALKVDGSAVTQPVSGTFWQATQPVSGTITANAGTGNFTVTQSTASNLNATATLAAGTALIGQVSASHETATIYNGTTALTPKFAVISASSSGDNSIVSAVSSKKIRVLRWSVSASAAVNIKWRNATTDITGLYYLAANKTDGGGYCPVGHFETSANSALQINLSGAVAVGGVLTYVEV